MSLSDWVVSVGDWCLVSDVSGQHGGPIFEGHVCSEDGTAMLYRNIRHQSSGIILQYPC